MFTTIHLKIQSIKSMHTVTNYALIYILYSSIGSCEEIKQKCANICIKHVGGGACNSDGNRVVALRRNNVKNVKIIANLAVR